MGVAAILQDRPRRRKAVLDSIPTATAAAVRERRYTPAVERPPEDQKNDEDSTGSPARGSDAGAPSGESGAGASDGGGAADRVASPRADVSHAEPRRITGDAVWAHNQWPVVGLYTGAGIGLALSFLFAIGLWWGLLATVGGGVAGLLLGYLAAVVIYHGRI